MTVVTETLLDVDEREAVITVCLAGTDGERIGEAYATDANETIVTSYQFRANASGVWSLALQANEDILPAGTVWRRTVALSDGTETTSYATVPDSTTQSWGDIVTDPPGALTSSALSVQAARIDALEAALADLATVASTGAYTDLTGEPVAGTTAGTYAAGDDVRFARAAYAVRTGYAAGEYAVSGVTAQALAAVSHPLDTIYLTPFRPVSAMTFDRMRIHVAATCNVRLGAYNSDGPVGSPGTRLFDAGVIAAVGSGEKELTGLSQALAAGVLYWLALVSDTTVNIVRYQAAALPPLDPLSLTGGTHNFAYQAPFTYAALPANLGIGSPATIKGTLAPAIQLRVA